MTTINNLTKRDLNRSNKICEHYWVHDHLGYSRSCMKCDKKELMGNRSISNLVKKIESDNCSDIRTHVSPSTVVTDLHVNEIDKLNRLG